jgi:hypothetical protein
MDTFYEDNKIYFTQRTIRFLGTNNSDPYKIQITKAKAGNVILYYQATWPRMTVEITKAIKEPNLYFVKSVYRVTKYGSDFMLKQETFEPVTIEQFIDLKNAIENGEFQFHEFK